MYLNIFVKVYSKGVQTCNKAIISSIRKKALSIQLERKHLGDRDIVE